MIKDIEYLLNFFFSFSVAQLTLRDRCILKLPQLELHFIHHVALARKQRMDLLVFESSCHLPTCLPHTAEASLGLFQCWTSSNQAVNTNFYSLWFVPTWNQTRVYRFSNRRSIHSNTDRLNDVIYTAKQFCEQSLKLYDFCENEITAHM